MSSLVSAHLFSTRDLYAVWFHISEMHQSFTCLCSTCAPLLVLSAQGFQQSLHQLANKESISPSQNPGPSAGIRPPPPPPLRRETWTARLWPQPACCVCTGTESEICWLFCWYSGTVGVSPCWGAGLCYFQLEVSLNVKCFLFVFNWVT